MNSHMYIGITIIFYTHWRKSLSRQMNGCAASLAQLHMLLSLQKISFYSFINFSPKTWQARAKVLKIVLESLVYKKANWNSNTCW